MILAGTQSQHQKQDSLIDLNEESSYMKQSQPMPDQLRIEASRDSEASPAVYMNSDRGVMTSFTESYSAYNSCLNARVNRFTFSAAISKSLELKRSSITL